jgi:hypothetical protein
MRVRVQIAALRLLPGIELLTDDDLVRFSQPSYSIRNRAQVTPRVKNIRVNKSNKFISQQPVPLPKHIEKLVRQRNFLSDPSHPASLEPQRRKQVHVRDAAEVAALAEEEFVALLLFVPDRSVRHLHDGDARSEDSRDRVILEELGVLVGGETRVVEVDLLFLDMLVV